LGEAGLSFNDFILSQGKGAQIPRTDKMKEIRPIQVIVFDLGDTLVTTGRTWILGAKEVLAGLRQSGIRLGLISNSGSFSREQLLEQLPVDFDLASFDDTLILLSSETGIEKPTLQLFEMAIARANVLASQCLFCTEDLLHTLAAQTAGMRSARLERPPNSDIDLLPETIAAFAKLQ